MFVLLLNHCIGFADSGFNGWLKEDPFFVEEPNEEPNEEHIEEANNEAGIFNVFNDENIFLSFFESNREELNFNDKKIYLLIAESLRLKINDNISAPFSKIYNCYLLLLRSEILNFQRTPLLNKEETVLLAINEIDRSGIENKEKIKELFCSIVQREELFHIINDIDAKKHAILNNPNNPADLEIEILKRPKEVLYSKIFLDKEDLDDLLHRIGFNKHLYFILNRIFNEALDSLFSDTISEEEFLEIYSSLKEKGFNPRVHSFDFISNPDIFFLPQDRAAVSREVFNKFFSRKSLKNYLNEDKPNVKEVLASDIPEIVLRDGADISEITYLIVLLSDKELLTSMLGRILNLNQNEEEKKLLFLYILQKRVFYSIKFNQFDDYIDCSFALIDEIISL